MPFLMQSVSEDSYTFALEIKKNSKLSTLNRIFSTLGSPRNSKLYHGHLLLPEKTELPHCGASRSATEDCGTLRGDQATGELCAETGKEQQTGTGHQEGGDGGIWRDI